MIKTICLLLEYGTYPVWLYDEVDNIIDNDNPPEWKDDKELTDVFMAVSDLYDTFFINNKIEFSYIGYPDVETRNRLIMLINTAVEILSRKNDGKYSIRNDISIDLDLPKGLC